LMFRHLREPLEFVRQSYHLLRRLDIPTEERNTPHKSLTNMGFNRFVDLLPLKTDDDQLPDFLLDCHASYQRIDLCVGEGEELGGC